MKTCISVSLYYKARSLSLSLTHTHTIYRKQNKYQAFSTFLSLGPRIKSLLDFSVKFYGKIWMNFVANSIQLLLPTWSLCLHPHRHPSPLNRVCPLLMLPPSCVCECIIHTCVYVYMCVIQFGLKMQPYQKHTPSFLFSFECQEEI